jgi:hypothetical protein
VKPGNRKRSFLLLIASVATCLNVQSAFGIQLNKGKLKSYAEAAHDLWRFDGVVLIAQEGRVLFSSGMV